MKFLFLFALLCTLVWISAAVPQPDESREVNRASRSTEFDKKSFDEEFLKAHNDYRKKHKVAPLIMSEKLSKYAQEWAENLVKIGQMKHRDQHEYGENIYYSWSSDPNFSVSGKQPVDSWYDEIKVHPFGKEPDGLESGHFTQVVWEDTKEVGVGLAKSNDGKVYVVANYYPPGNMMGSFAKKVHPPEP